MNAHILRIVTGIAALMLALGVPSGGLSAPPAPPALTATTTCIHGGDPGFQVALPHSGQSAVAVDPGFSVPGSGHPDPGFSVRLPACK